MWVQLHQLYGHVQLGEHWTWNHPRETWCQAAGSRSLGGTSFAEKKDLSELVETEDKCAMEQLPSQTDIHSLISMQNRKKKKDQWVFERRKRQAFIFRSGCPWSGDSTSFWGGDDDEESTAFA